MTEPYYKIQVVLKRVSKNGTNIEEIKHLMVAQTIDDREVADRVFENAVDVLGAVDLFKDTIYISKLTESLRK